MSRNWRDEALKKLDDQRKNVTGNKEKAMAECVRSALRDFCCQNEEFAQAVAQGGSFKDCMAAVARGVGTSISDLDAYKRAVEFYFPGAKVEMKMTIDLIGDAAELPDKTAEKPTTTKRTSIALDLADFF